MFVILGQPDRRDWTLNTIVLNKKSAKIHINDTLKSNDSVVLQ